ncbi:cellulase family glycosylhydrolase [Cohnella nanjingensis]|uniref:Cellulase family glycosylhydrolase n=1 Tax=Cohnella nanjingensis TaxID=1387779 RepID=A0A7X0VHT4_9BACL|nr:cellulase family glycosylhydrolase [Cohnella nanjingensis]MBB6672984.1 cellulase family glycosylhydrolase [Cohnella nanjingensis]
MNWGAVRSKALPVALAASILLIGGCSAAKSGDDKPRAACAGKKGLCVDEAGTLMKDGKPYRGAGVNYFNAFARTLLDPGDTTYRHGFEVLKNYHIPFARFMACGYWPSEFKLYLENKEKYFQLMDGVVKAAEDNGIGLIPSLFWYHSAVPDLVKEPRDQWGNPDSKTMVFMREYVRLFVTRYKDSPAIWGWEFGNEYNLETNLPNAADHRPLIYPNLGTATERSARDDLTTSMLQTAFAEFGKEVRKYDPDRIIITGNSMPRPTAWNQRKSLRFQQDTEGQFAEILAAENPNPANVISVHYYPGDEQRFGHVLEHKEMLSRMMDIAREVRKPLFIGEFGVSDAVEEGGLLDPELAEKKYMELAGAIGEAKVPLSALWVYDFYGQSENNVTADNGRAYQLTALAQLNDQLAKS